MLNNKKSCAVIAAAGSGRRMGGVSKPNIKLLGKTLFEYVLDAVCDSFVDEIVVVCSEDNEKSLRGLSVGYNKQITFVRGGETRADSVYNGIAAASEDVEIFCVHDCARPLITAAIIEETVRAASEYKASCVCSPVTDTVKYRDPETGAITTPQRSNLFAVQTPQCFEKELYLRARDFAGEKCTDFTDETALLEHFGAEVKYITCTEPNMKLTNICDIAQAEAIIKFKQVNNND